MATPIIAAVYALAGAPAPGSDPAAFPYQDRAALYDVTVGQTSMRPIQTAARRCPTPRWACRLA